MCVVSIESSCRLECGLRFSQPYGDHHWVKRTCRIKVWWYRLGMGFRVGETGGSELARPALMAPPPRAIWRRRIVLDRYLTRVATLPTFLVMLGVFGMPLAFSFYLGFTGYAQGQGLFSGGYVGLENYEDLLSDRVFTGSIAITLVYTAAVVAAEMVLGLGIALLLDMDRPGIRICRNALIILTMVTPIVGADVRSPISQDLAGQRRVGILTT